MIDLYQPKHFAFRAGVRAYKVGKPTTANPYIVGSVWAKYWIRGYLSVMEKGKLTMKENCTNCVFSRKNEKALNTYLCHRYPPLADMILVQGPTGPQPAGTVSYLPGVSENDWCGEYQQLIRPSL